MAEAGASSGGGPGPRDRDRPLPHEAGEARDLPRIVVVGAASRDRASDDPRGWRLGGGVSYGGLALARLGVPTGVLVGVDDAASRAPELDLLRAAGADVRLVRLAHGPVFDNLDTPNGRTQIAFDVSDALSPDVVPKEWRDAPAWLLAPVAGELTDDWAQALPADGLVALGWQGLLRELRRSERVLRRAPRPSALLRRADIVGVSRDDLEPSVAIGDLTALLRPGALLCLTAGAAGGVAVRTGGEGRDDLRRWPGIEADALVDPTGAGDVFLSTLLAVHADARLAGGTPAPGSDLLVAAAAASLVLERRGLLGVADRATVAARMARARRS